MPSHAQGSAFAAGSIYQPWGTVGGASTHFAESPIVSRGDLITLFAYLAIASCCR